VECPRALGQVQAAEIRVKTQGGIVWMARARMVKTRLWLAGAVRAPRDLPLIRRLRARVRRWAAPAPLWRCTDGLSADVRAMRVAQARLGALGWAPGALSTSRRSCSALCSGAWSTASAVSWRARPRVSRRSGVARQGTG
jgi:hypothetical protein